MAFPHIYESLKGMIQKNFRATTLDPSTTRVLDTLLIRLSNSLPVKESILHVIIPTLFWIQHQEILLNKLRQICIESIETICFFQGSCYNPILLEAIVMSKALNSKKLFSTFLAYCQEVELLPIVQISPGGLFRTQHQRERHIQLEGGGLIQNPIFFGRGII